MVRQTPELLLDFNRAFNCRLAVYHTDKALTLKNFKVFHGKSEKHGQSMLERFRVELGEGTEPLIVGDDGKNTNYDKCIDFASFKNQINEIRFHMYGFGEKDDTYCHLYLGIHFIGDNGKVLAKMESEDYQECIQKYCYEMGLMITKESTEISHLS